MTLGRVIYIFGILLIVYAVISGFNFHFSMHDGEYDYSNSYSFKIGTLIIGVILIFLGKRTQEKE